MAGLTWYWWSCSSYVVAGLVATWIPAQRALLDRPNDTAGAKSETKPQHRLESVLRLARGSRASHLTSSVGCCQQTIPLIEAVESIFLVRAVGRRHGSNRQERYPKSLATFIALGSHTLATIAERISHSIRRPPSQEPLESSTIVEPVAIMTRLIFSVPLYVLRMSRRCRNDLPSSAGRPFSCHSFSRALFGLIPASCSFAASALPVPP